MPSAKKKHIDFNTAKSLSVSLPSLQAGTARHIVAITEQILPIVCHDW